jgi:hypothetical protein
MRQRFYLLAQKAIHQPNTLHVTQLTFGLKRELFALAPIGGVQSVIYCWIHRRRSVYGYVVFGDWVVSNNSNSKVRRTSPKDLSKVCLSKVCLSKVWRSDRIGRVLFAFVLFDDLCGGACRGKCGSLARAAC